MRGLFTGLVGSLALAVALIYSVFAQAVFAQDEVKELNLYSSRHYQTDEALYGNFTAETGIRINRLEGRGDELIERIRNEGVNSPADVLITVDAGRLWRAEQAGIFAATTSAALDAAVPANLRHPDGLWYGFSTRARLIFYNKELIDPAGLEGYEDLADAKWRDQICIRSSSNIYNLSLMAALIAHHGEEAAEAWAEGVVANFARQPQGGDTDQIRAVAAGECGIAVANSYYFARLMRSTSLEDQAVVAKIGVVFPNQGDRGTHVNVSGAGMAKNAPNPEHARLFLEYLASEPAQRYFADGNNEYPAVASVAPNAALGELGAFTVDSLNVSALGRNQAAAQIAFDRAGWK